MAAIQFPRATAPLPPNEDAGPALLISSSILISFVIVTTLLRLYVRARNHNLGWDDYTIGITAAMAVTRFSAQVAQIHHGNGKHRAYLSPQDYTTSNMFGWYAQLLLFAGMCMLKVSICLLLLRIKDEKKLRYLMYATMAGLVITNGGVIIILLAECSPVEAYWMGNGKCWDSKVRIYSIYVTIGYGIVTDLLCSLLPLAVVWKVRIPLRTKAMVCGLMSLGLLVTGFGVGRASSLGYATDDLTWVYAIAAIWANFELYLGIVAANLALLRSIYIYFFGDPSEEAGSRSRSTSSRTAAYLQAKLRCENCEQPKTIIESGHRRPESAGSEQSEIPLTPAGIQKKTEFWISEEDLRRKRSRRESSSTHA